MNIEHIRRMRMKLQNANFALHQAELTPERLVQEAFVQEAKRELETALRWMNEIMAAKEVRS